MVLLKLRGFILLVSMFPSLVITQIITSNLNDETFACPNSEVIFTCITTDSNGIAWSSNEYIGPGGAQLEISAVAHTVGSRLNSTINQSTFVMLTRNDPVLNILEAQLHVIASVASTVKCRHVSGNTVASLTFQLTAYPESPEDPFAVGIQIRHECLVSFTFRAPNNSNEARVSNYLIFNNGTLIRNQTVNINGVNGTKISSLLRVCGAYRMSIFAVNKCGHMSASSPMLNGLDKSHHILNGSEFIEVVRNNNTVGSNNKAINDGAISLFVISVPGFAGYVPVVIIVTIFIHKKCKNHKDKSSKVKNGIEFEQDSAESQEITKIN